MIKLCVGATISSQSVPGQNIVLVRPRTLGQTNPKEHNGLVPMEGDEEIFEEEAVCKFCFDILKEENILKTECKCGNALIHEECAANWSRTRGFGRLEFLNIFRLLGAISAVASPNIKGVIDERHNLISIFNLMSFLSILCFM
ncbi:hypothetical protein HYC85_003260 [Camellia sinensis]|uniref:RING-CH-type domain-containing protein n=1 Tax=Camellia sinensis TaxID=4442 RepID=A0A7J7IBX4_CAMSI|nr:hypothetical protein HYC85_003260 [Camellia sinensis]